MGHSAPSGVFCLPSRSNLGPAPPGWRRARPCNPVCSLPTPCLQVLAFILSVCLMAHLSACVFYYMAYLDGLGPNTWVAAYGVQDAGECGG